MTLITSCHRDIGSIMSKGTFVVMATVTSEPAASMTPSALLCWRQTIEPILRWPSDLQAKTLRFPYRNDYAPPRL